VSAGCLVNTRSSDRLQSEYFLLGTGQCNRCTQSQRDASLTFRNASAARVYRGQPQRNHDAWAMYSAHVAPRGNHNWFSIPCFGVRVVPSARAARACPSQAQSEASCAQAKRRKLLADTT
jgi:hypothetical protein